MTWVLFVFVVLADHRAVLRLSTGAQEHAGDAGDGSLGGRTAQLWAINLNKELAGTGVYTAHVGIDVSINQSVIPGFPVAPEQLSSLWIRIF